MSYYKNITIKMKPILAIVLLIVPVKLLFASDYYKFDIPWDATLPNKLIDDLGFSSINGSIVFPVRARGDKFYDQSNAEARFWGIAITISKHFPSASRGEIDKVVKKISHFGFNLVRINGIDYPGYGLFDKWYRTGRLDKSLMDKLDYFVYALRREGIGYSFSINNNTLKADLIEGVDKNSHPVRHKSYKYVQLFDDKIIDVVKKWHYSFYSHTNKYTNISYAYDDYNVYATIIGEDSLINAYMRANGEYLTDKQFNLLQKMFNGFLKEKYKSHKELEKSWKKTFRSSILLANQNLDKGTITLNKYKEFKGLTASNKADIIEFLSSLDTKYGREILDVLNDVGFQGSVAFTNDWYGYGSLLVNSRLGDFLDLHAYFDPMMFSKVSGERREMVRDISYIDILSEPEPFDSTDLNKNIKIFFSSSVQGYPVLVTEWNHSLLSRHLYEGPVLMVLLGAFHGYSGMVAHTYFSPRKNGFKKSYSNNSLLVQGNPVFMALSPAISYIYRERLIQEFDEVYKTALNRNVYEFAADDGLYFKDNKHREIFKNAFNRKIKIKLGENDNKPDEVSGGLSPALNISRGTLFYENDYVWVLAGKLSGSKNNVVTYSGDGKEGDRGAIFVISLDGKKIPDSENVFITTVSHFVNTQQKMKYIGKFRQWDNVSSVLDYGESPTLLKKMNGKLKFKMSGSQGAYKLSRITNNGKVEGLNILQQVDGYVVVDLSNTNSPWLWITKNND